MGRRGSEKELHAFQKLLSNFVGDECGGNVDNTS